MADREAFPYEDDWRRDGPVLMELGIMPAVAKGIIELHPSHTDRVAEALHCRAVWSEWSFARSGEPFLNIQYKYPSIILGENETGHFGFDEGPIQTNDPELLTAVAGLANTRTTEIWRPLESGLFVPAVAA